MAPLVFGILRSLLRCPIGRAPLCIVYGCIGTEALILNDRGAIGSYQKIKIFEPITNSLFWCAGSI
jgi:hypothetical protein